MALCEAHVTVAFGCMMKKLGHLDRALYGIMSPKRKMVMAGG